MTVHCNKCGYQNDLQHSFCGKCGAKLPVPSIAEQAAPQAPPVEPQKPPPATISGPSILGLAGQPSDQDRLSYLLEDDEHPSPRWPRMLLVAVVVAAVAIAGWHWRENVRGWIASVSSGASTSQITEPPAASQTPPSEATAPAPSNPSGASADSATSSTDLKPESQLQPAPASAASQPDAPPARIGTTEAIPPPSASTPADAQNAVPPATGPDSAVGKKSESAAQVAREVPQPAPPAKVSRSASEAPAADADAVEAEGERYLYGNGVTANCGVAQKRLLAAAKMGNAKAHSVLGTMYATGHCVGRDLPVAYRWFAKALHQDSSNTRYERDLEVLWRQMTEEERQVALKSQ